MDREEAVSARPSAASPAVPSDDPPRACACALGPRPRRRRGAAMLVKVAGRGPKGALPDLAGARGVSATSQQTENREDPGAGEDSPLLPYGAFQASTSPTPQLVGHRDEGPERP